jgi:hypothetical protein
VQLTRTECDPVDDVRSEDERGEALTVGSNPERYVPAAGRFGLTALYDTTVGLTMREEAWRPAFAQAATADAQDGDVLDVGCGAGAVTHARWRWRRRTPGSRA